MFTKAYIFENENSLIVSNPMKNIDISNNLVRNIYYPTMFGHISIEITKHLQN
jgi:hypothetical protein